MKNWGAKGFTFVELMVVLVVIGVLATISLPNFRSTFEITKGREAEATLRMIFEAERAFYFAQPPQNRHYTVTNTDLALYLPAWPASANWTYTLSTTDPTPSPSGPQNFTATATRSAPSGTPPNAGETITINQAGTLDYSNWSPEPMPTPSIDQLLAEVVKKRASDLHLTVGLPPQLRIDGRLIRLPYDVLTPEITQELTYQLLTPQQIHHFEQFLELDTAYSISGISRFRVNCYRQRGSIATAIRTIPFEVPSLDTLGLPPVLKDFSDRPSGLIIVSGPTGSGKSTTLAALISHINQKRNCHIVSIEDPIEYLHKHGQATINQRELGPDTRSFHEALRHVVRQDPNVILIGEMRDLETMHAALTLAETGHLVMTTLHTADATHAINRIVDVFPPHQQQQIRVQLSLVLIGIVVQQLIPKSSGQGRGVAYEVMNVTPAIGSLIRENDLHQIKSAIQTGRRFGMITMTQCLAELYQQGFASWDEIVRRSPDPNELATLIHQKP